MAIRLCVLKQRLSFSVFGNDGSALDWLPAEQARNTDDDRGNKQKTHDDKGKDPLEGNDSGLELSDTDSWQESVLILKNIVGWVDLQALKTDKANPML